jgi:hypothetical protein
MGEQPHATIMELAMITPGQAELGGAVVRWGAGGGSDEFLVAGSSYRLNVRGGRYRRNRDGRAFFRSQVRERWR